MGDTVDMVIDEEERLEEGLDQDMYSIQCSGEFDLSLSSITTHELSLVITSPLCRLLQTEPLLASWSQVMDISYPLEGQKLRHLT